MIDDAHRRPVSLVFCFLYVIPVLVHFGALANDLRTQGYFQFRKDDLVVLSMLVLYLLSGFLVVRFPQIYYRFCLTTWTALISIVVCEAVLFAAGIRFYPELPWHPMKRVSYAADTMPGVYGEIELTINDMGVRAPVTWPVSRADRILCIGGSATECLCVTDKKTWPWLLGQRLSDRLGRTVLVANAGRSGHFTLHHEYQLRHYRDVKKFGCVVVLCGINDAGTFLRQNYSERAACVPGEALVGRHGNLPYYKKSAIFTLVQRTRKTRQRHDWEFPQDASGAWYRRVRMVRQELLVTHPLDAVPDGLSDALSIYRDALRRIIRQCEMNGQSVYFLTQPTMYHNNMPQSLEELLWEHTSEGAYTPEVLATVINAYNRALLAVCAESGVSCIDLASQLSQDTTVFYDDCHFNIQGCKTVAGALLPYFVSEMGARGDHVQ